MRRHLTRLAAIAAASLLTACNAPSAPRAQPTAQPAATPTSQPPAITSTEPWSFAGFEGEILRTTHYRIFTTADNQVLKQRIPLFLERALQHYRVAALTDPLNPLPLPTSSLDTYFMDSRPQWETLTTKILGPARDAALNIERGGFATRGIGVYFDIGLFDTLAVASHEGWHQFTQRTFRQPLPTYLEEGLATYMEGHRWIQATPVFAPWANPQRYDQLRAASTRDELFTLDELTTQSPQQLSGFGDDRILTYYAQVWALTHFLHEQHPQALDALLRDASAGRLAATLARNTTLSPRAAVNIVRSRRSPAVLHAYINTVTPAQLADDYAEFTRRLVATGSRNAIVQGNSPLAP